MFILYQQNTRYELFTRRPCSSAVGCLLVGENCPKENPKMGLDSPFSLKDLTVLALGEAAGCRKDEELPVDSS